MSQWAHVSSLSLIVTIQTVSIDCTPSHEIEAICQDRSTKSQISLVLYLSQAAHSGHNEHEYAISTYMLSIFVENYLRATKYNNATNLIICFPLLEKARDVTTLK